MRSPGPGSVEGIATELYRMISEQALDDLRSEDTALAVEIHFEPVRVRALPATDFGGGECSIDGYYLESSILNRPTILYADKVAPERARFTVLHEVGHHLLQNDGAHLLDPIDLLGRSAAGAARVEELVCHNLAGQILIPRALLDEVIGDDVLIPTHVIELHDRTNASWEAVAVSAAAHTPKASVVLVRKPGSVAFAASNGLPRWQRGSILAPNGPLSRAFSHSVKATADIYRYGLPHAERLFCGTTRVDDQLAIGVLTPERSDGRCEILGQPEPAWKRETFCRWCGEERVVGWCAKCSGRRCRSCDRCGCGAPVENPLCPECFLKNPLRPGSRVCVDCEK